MFTLCMEEQLRPAMRLAHEYSSIHEWLQWYSLYLAHTVHVVHNGHLNTDIHVCVDVIPVVSCSLTHVHACTYISLLLPLSHPLFVSPSSPLVYKYRFNVIVYSTSVHQWKPGLVLATQENRNEACQWFLNQSGGGSSCLLDALRVSNTHTLT